MLAPNTRWAGLIDPSDAEFSTAIEEIGRKQSRDPGYAVMAAENLINVLSGKPALAQANKL